jgi:hypothetical protein
MDPVLLFLAGHLEPSDPYTPEGGVLIELDLDTPPST